MEAPSALHLDTGTSSESLAVEKSHGRHGTKQELSRTRSTLSPDPYLTFNLPVPHPTQYRLTLYYKPCQPTAIQSLPWVWSRVRWWGFCTECELLDLRSKRRTVSEEQSTTPPTRPHPPSLPAHMVQTSSTSPPPPKSTGCRLLTPHWRQNEQHK